MKERKDYKKVICPNRKGQNAICGISPDDMYEAYLCCNDCGFEKIEHI